mgnify:FL=1
MTLEEAKKILKKEIFGIRFKKFDKPLKFEEMLWIRNEKPEVIEALHIVAKNGIGVSVPETVLRIRSLIIKKMKAGEGEPAPVSGTPLSAAEGMKLRWKDNKNTDKNPALAESATQFNDALLDEQAKKIAELTKDKELIKKAALSQLDDFIEIYNLLTKESQKAKRLGKEIAKLNGIIHGKNAILSGVAEGLRLSKIREKNLTEVCQKYVKEVDDLREKLADKVVDKIDAQALKSAESALAWKEKVIAEKDMAIAYNEKMIADLQEKLAATKKELEGANNLVEIVRKGSKEYCEYGIAAEKMIQKMEKDIVNDRPVSPKDYEQYRHWAKGYRFNPQLPERTDEEEKKLNTAKSTLDDLKEKAYNSFNAKAHNLGPVGSKDGNGISDQMIGVDIAGEGGDHSAIIAQCCKNIAISKDEAEIIERCTKNGTELHYSEKDGLTYTNMYGEEMPIRCLRGMFHVFTDEEIKNMKK